MTRGRLIELGTLFPWDDHFDRKRVLDHRDWFKDLERSGLPLNDDIVRSAGIAAQAFPSQIGTPFREVAASIYAALRIRDLSTSVDDIAEITGVDRRAIFRRLKDSDLPAKDIRTPEDVVKAHGDSLGPAADDILARLSEFPGTYKHSGRNPNTIAAVATYLTLEDATAEEVCEIFDTSQTSLYYAKRELPEDLR